MAYPLIIFGAGASYDFSHIGKAGDVAPLTKNLADEKFHHTDLIGKYEGVGSLLSDIIHQVKNGKNFEDVLSDKSNRAQGSTQLLANLSALYFYLETLFERISTPNDLNRRIHLANNYHIILDRIHEHAEGKALVATFNYDTLFENSLPRGSAPNSMQDYISGGIKIIKLQGSHDWSYVQPVSTEDLQYAKDGFELWMKNPNVFDNFHIKGHNPRHKNELKTAADNRIGDVHYLQLPALALPLTGKDRYVCPESHTQALERALPEVDRVLIIGWRAGDPLLLKMLKKHLRSMKYKILVVSNGIESAKEIVNSIKGALGIHYADISAYKGKGFSGFVSDEISNTFFA